MIRNRPVYPHTSSRQIQRAPGFELSRKNQANFDELLHVFRDTLIELSQA